MKRVAYSLLDLADRVIFDVAENLSEMDVECYFVACRDIDFVVDKTKFWFLTLTYLTRRINRMWQNL